MTREDRVFISADSRCAAWFYPPPAEPAPCVVLAHGFGATREAGLDAYARRFAAAGLAVLVFDYRNFGASGGKPRQVLDIRSQLQDWTAAVAYARKLPEVDAGRIALWGSSFSGGHVVTTAAHDPAIAAVIAQVPYLGLVRRRRLPQARIIRLALTSIRDNLRALRHSSRPLLIPIIGEPGSKALLQGSHALAQFHELLPPDAHWVNEVAARVVIRLPSYRPVSVANQVRCPIFYCSCSKDKITPAALVATAAAASPQGWLAEYEGEHFEVYSGHLFDRVVDDQVQFLQEHLSAAPTNGPVKNR
ncbi:alpha/beta fold hydrolase [Fodinicola feengrottensis]|uniref:Alpha/beta fold hydrolase n=1 Tax=Fodinicola feengrottensis TaxID=435914 RepID=A0ABN2IDM3_9ACTN